MRRFLAAALAAVVVVALAAPALAGPRVIKAQVRNFSFGPKKLTIKRGTKVTWRFVSGYHDVTVKSGPVKFTSHERLAPASFSHVFTKAGTYHLYCKVHSWMKETVVVK